MHKAAVGITITLGALAVLGTFLWSTAGAGIFGSPFGGMHGNEGFYTFILLAAGPLSLLPAGLVGRRRPLTAGAWLLAGGIFDFFWHLGVILNDGFGQLFRSNPTLEAWVPVTLICTPMLLLGSAFLWAGRAVLISKVRSPEIRRRLAIGAAALGGAAVLGLLIMLLTRPIWTVTVRPVGEGATSRRFDARDCQAIMDGDLGTVFKPLFKNPGPAQRTLLGTYELSGPKDDKGMVRPLIYECVAERRPGGWLLIWGNSKVLGSDQVDEKAFEHARRNALLDIFGYAVKEHPPDPR
jgi:hypothetical protein